MFTFSERHVTVCVIVMINGHNDTRHTVDRDALIIR